MPKNGSNPTIHQSAPQGQIGKSLRNTFTVLHPRTKAIIFKQICRLVLKLFPHLLM